MVIRTGMVMDPRKQRTVDALIEAAEQIFATHTVDEVTVEQIAATAKVSVASIYNHFESKAGLHAAVVQRALAVDKGFMDLAYVPGRTPEDQVTAAAEQYLQFYLNHPDFFRMLAFPADPGQYPAGHEAADRLAESVAEQNARLANAVGAGIKFGLVRPLDPAAVATVLWAAWNGIISLAWRQDSLRCNESELRSLLATASDIIANGLRQPPSSS